MSGYMYGLIQTSSTPKYKFASRREFLILFQRKAKSVSVFIAGEASMISLTRSAIASWSTKESSSGGVPDVEELGASASERTEYSGNRSRTSETMVLNSASFAC